MDKKSYKNLDINFDPDFDKIIKSNHLMIRSLIDQINQNYQLDDYIDDQDYDYLNDIYQINDHIIDNIYHLIKILINNLDYYFDKILKDYDQNNLMILNLDPDYLILKSINIRLKNLINYDPDIDDLWIIIIDNRFINQKYINQIDYYIDLINQKIYQSNQSIYQLKDK